MESPTVTVPTTQVYYHRENGTGLRMTEGDVITQRKAWLYQVAGATEPVGTSGLVATITDPQGGDIPVYREGTWINLPKFGAELVADGGFENDPLSWEAWDGGETVTIDASSGTSYGTKALKVVTTGDNADEGAISGDPIMLDGVHTLRFRIRLWGAGTHNVWLRFGSAMNQQYPVNLAGSDASHAVVIHIDAPIPEAATQVQIYTSTPTSQAVTYWIDDVSLRVVNT